MAIREKDSKESKKRYYRLFLALVILIGLFLVPNVGGNGSIIWNDFISSKVIASDGTISQYSGTTLQMLNRGDQVLMRVQLPAEKAMSQAVLCFNTYHAVVTVSYQGEELETYGAELDRSGYMIGAVYMQVEIPESAWGSELQIEFKVREDRAFSSLSDFKMYKADRAYISFYEGQWANLIILMFLMVASFVGLYVFFLAKGISMPKEMLYLLLFVFDCSLWLFIYSGLYRIFFEGYVWVNLEYLVLYVAPVPLLLYFFEKDGDTSKYKNTYFYLGVAWGLFAVLTVILNLTGLVHYNEFALGTQVAMISTGIYVLATGFAKRASSGDRLVAIGMMVLTMMWLLEITRFLLVKYAFQTYLDEIYYIPTFGLLCFIICMLSAVYEDMEAKHRQITAMNHEIRQLEEQVRMTYINGMLSQIQPHFLYNTLSSIRTIIKIEPDRAYDMLYDFTVYLRGSLKLLSTENQIAFAEELKNIRAYLNVEKMRLGKRLEIRMDIQNNDFKIPPLTIQPLVENAVKHGIFPKGKQKGYIEVKTWEEGGYHWVAVNDNGVGFDPAGDAKKSDAVGLVNLKYRIEHLVNGKIDIVSTLDEGTRVTVKIPKEGE